MAYSAQVAVTCLLFMQFFQRTENAIFCSRSKQILNYLDLYIKKNEVYCEKTINTVHILCWWQNKEKQEHKQNKIRLKNKPKRFGDMLRQRMLIILKDHTVSFCRQKQQQQNRIFFLLKKCASSRSKIDKSSRERNSFWKKDKTDNNNSYDNNKK